MTLGVVRWRWFFFQSRRSAGRGGTQSGTESGHSARAILEWEKNEDAEDEDGDEDMRRRMEAAGIEDSPCSRSVWGY